MSKKLFLFILFLVALNANAQFLFKNIDRITNPSKVLDFKVDYTYQQTDGDLAKRFGVLHHISGGVMFKLKNNWCADVALGYQFGYEIKEPGLLYFLTNSSGTISNTGGYPANYSIGERGLTTTLRIGKIIPFLLDNPNSGIMIMAGGGYYMHKINIKNTTNDIPTLTPELKKGYDRLTAGFGFSEFIGYVFHSPNRYINFYIGLDIVQAYTKSLRGYNFDQRMVDNKDRFDVTYGLRVGWMFPVYLGSKDEDEFDFR